MPACHNRSSAGSTSTDKRQFLTDAVSDRLMSVIESHHEAFQGCLYRRGDSVLMPVLCGSAFSRVSSSLRIIADSMLPLEVLAQTSNANWQERCYGEWRIDVGTSSLWHTCVWNRSSEVWALGHRHWNLLVLVTRQWEDHLWFGHGTELLDNMCDKAHKMQAGHCATSQTKSGNHVLLHCELPNHNMSRTVTCWLLGSRFFYVVWWTIKWTCFEQYSPLGSFTCLDPVWGTTFNSLCVMEYVIFDMFDCFIVLPGCQEGINFPQTLSGELQLCQPPHRSRWDRVQLDWEELCGWWFWSNDSQVRQASVPLEITSMKYFHTHRPVLA